MKKQLAERQAIAYAKDLAILYRGERQNSRELASIQKKLEETNNELQLYARELAELYKKEKEHRRRIEKQYKAIEIANTQLKHFTGGLNKALKDLESSYLETLECLALAAEFKDHETGRHIVRISRFSERLATLLGLPDDEVKMISLAAPMHDIGKVGVPDTLLCKPGKLTFEEFEQMKLHTVIGHKILSRSKAPLLQLAREIALTHHEKWNGKGYPHGLAKGEIPPSGRIVAVVDVFDALVDVRPYKNPYPEDVAWDIMERESGQSFDPQILKVFLKHFDEFVAIRWQHESRSDQVEMDFRWSERDHKSV